jgi:hypothetical protein
MTKLHTFSIVSITASAFAVWLYIFTQMQPDKGDVMIMLTFFVSLLVWVGSLIAYILYTIKTRQNNGEVIFAHIAPSIRQGFIVAGTVVFLLFLKMLRVVSAWDIVLVIAIAVALELGMRHKAVPQTRRGTS